MFRLDADLRVYLHRDAVDFRAGINGLVTRVEQSMQRLARDSLKIRHISV
jgi:transposase